MKKNNQLILILTLLSIFTNCSKTTNSEDPLILPPNFEEMPDVKNLDKNSNSNQLPKESDADTKELRDLLLKGQ